jgi:alkylation response protein AidB-like acyl-CoA dehydrogenase
MDFDLTEEQTILRESVRKMMDRVATPEYIRRLDREQAYPYELYDSWVETGLLGLAYPEEYGGVGGSVIDIVIAAEEVSRKSADFFMAFAGSTFCGLNILRKATSEQKQYWLPKIVAGEVRMAVSISEPEAGSDVAAMRTVAKRDGDEWVISGHKLWSTGAGAKNAVINAYVKTNPAAPIRDAMSLFLVDNSAPGLEIRKLDMLGRRCVGTYELIFNDVRVPGNRLVGGENKGWDCILSGLQVERVCSAAGNCGAAQDAFDQALQYSKERKQFGRAIGTNQAIAHMLADAQTELEAARSLMWRAAWMVASGKDALREISMAKLLTSETYVKIANMGMQILGAYGYSMEFDMQRHYRDSRASTVAAGSSQIQRNLIAGLMGLKIDAYLH